MERADDEPLRCPSAQPDMPGAQVLGVVRRTPAGPRLSYVAGAAPVTDALRGQLQQAAGATSPMTVVRFAAQCQTSQCRHYDGAACSLASRIVELLPPVAEALPACAIRRTCRWRAEQGPSICLTCPQVVTQSDRAKTDARLGEGAPQTTPVEASSPA